MHLSAGIFALPASILLLITRSPLPVASHELKWPYNLPSHLKYFPEDEALIKRELTLQQRLQQQPALGVRKMSADPDQKFYLDYWSFDISADDHNFDSWTNSSALGNLHPRVPLHSNKTIPKAPRHVPFSFWNRSPLEQRDFQCPSGTNSCNAIGYPNSCCPTGETCQIVEDTGIGNIGCCPAGATCAGSVSACDAGQTACAANLGGGCCIAGYACLDVGCVYVGTATVLITPTPSSTFGASTTTLTLTTVITPAVPSASPTTVTSTSTIIPMPTPESTSTLIIVPTTSTLPTSTTTTSTTSIITIPVETCSPSFKSCPASLGGGCCPTDRACGSGALCPALSSTDTPNAPVRPTTDTTTTTAAATTITGAGCPTGFYACSAYYQGGCCQVGRDCAKTNCPAAASTTLVSGSGVTIVAPTGNGISTANLVTGVCATGWQTCAASNGGGCCPAGYACGASCTATASGGGGSVTGKKAPQSGGAMSISRRSMDRVVLFGLFIVIVLL